MKRESSQVEGNWQPVFPVLIEFPSLEQVHRWYDSEEYRELKALRLAARRSNAVFIEGTALGDKWKGRTSAFGSNH